MTPLSQSARVIKALLNDYAAAYRGAVYTFAQWTAMAPRHYRVELHPRTGGVEVLRLGLTAIDKSLDGVYRDISALPEWMQRRLAVLAMLKLGSPMQEVKGVGYRVSENVYWVESEEGETDT